MTIVLVYVFLIATSKRAAASNAEMILTVLIKTGEESSQLWNIVRPDKDNAFLVV